MDGAPEALVCLMTCPDVDTAARIGRALVEEKLAACVNIVPAVRSIYAWNGAVCDEPEVLCVMKTTHAGFERMRARAVALHPYEVPEVLAIGVSEGHAPYLAWLRAGVGG